MPRPGSGFLVPGRNCWRLSGCTGAGLRQPSLLRNKHQTILAELHARGEELVQRYAAAASREGVDAGDAGDAGMAGAVDRIVQARQPLLAALAELECAYADLPKAGNQERTELETVVDRLRQVAEDDQALAERLREADAEWLEGVEQAFQEDWSKAEIALIERLANHLRWSLQMLDQASIP